MTVELGQLTELVLGLSPAAGACYTLCTALGEFFIHMNCRTPCWVGYVPEREERLPAMFAFRDVHERAG